MRSKQIVLLTYGTRGDVQPFVALGVGLRDAGYKVRIAAPSAYCEFIQTHGLEFAPLPGDPGVLAHQLVEYAGFNPLRMVKAVGEFVLPLAVETLRAARDTCEDAEAIIHSFLMTEAGYQIAFELGIPDISAQFFPIFTPTASFPSMTFPDLKLGGIYRRATHNLTSNIFRHSGRALYQYLKHKHADLPKLPDWPFTNKTRHKTPILYAISPTVLPQPADWPNSSIITGYWTLDPPANWTPPVDMVKFISAGTPPIFIGIGSIPSKYGQKLSEIFIQAINQTRQRAVITIEGIGEDQFDNPECIFCIDNVPHSWLFPRMKAVIHHGGAGTTAAGLAAGVPNIVIPFASDQAFWGQRVHQLGAGPKPIHYKQLTAQRLIQALNTGINNEGVRERAKELGKRIRQEDGTAQAVQLISKHITSAEQI